MNKKLGLFMLYVLLIGSALSAPSRGPIENPLTIILVDLSILAILLVLLIRQRRQKG
jgi:hypothetical protein